MSSTHEPIGEGAPSTLKAGRPTDGDPAAPPWMSLWGGVIGYCFFIFVLSAQSFLSVPQTVPSADKGAHAVLYAGLGWLWARAVFVSRPTWSARFILLTTLSFTALYGISDEWHQLYVPDRMADVRDVFADAVGGTLGGVGFLVWRQMMKIMRPPIAVVARLSHDERRISGMLSDTGSCGKAVWMSRTPHVRDAHKPAPE